MALSARSRTEDVLPVQFSMGGGAVLIGIEATRGEHGKTIYDRVHDQVRLPPALVAVLDTPEFQRLRQLHQLGATSYLFPSATHTRFEHSIGVAHLAMMMLRRLVANHREVPSTHGPQLDDVTPEDVLCIGLAGLCHDLGHGPMSHMFETFIQQARKRRGVTAPWHHEDASEQLFDHLLQSNSIDMSVFGLSAEDLTFVKRLISGLRPRDPWPEDIGRPESKRYLFDIVANKRNGIDVDKLDYFLRDSLSCFGRLPDVHVDRIISCARVVVTDGQAQVCFEQKVALTLSDLFHLRAKLHKFVYQHRTTKVVEQMILNALLLAEEGGFKIAANGRDFLLSETVDDMAAYALTGDWILQAIIATSSPALQPARDELMNIHTRNLYDLVGYCDVTDHGAPDASEIIEHLPPASRMKMRANNVVVLTSRIVYGSSGDKPGDPIRNVRFFNPKMSLTETSRIKENQISRLFTPRHYQETTLLVYSRNCEFNADLTRAFDRWKDSARVTETIDFANAASPSPHRSVYRARAARSPADGVAGASQRSNAEIPLFPDS